MNEPASSARPVLWAMLRPVNGDSEKLRRALSKLKEEDAAFSVDEEDLDGQIVIRVMSELQLENICERLAREHNVYVHCGTPEIIYLETIRDTSAAEGKFISQHGRSHYAHIVIRIEPNPGKEYELVNELPEGAIPEKYVGPAGQGIRYAMTAGVIAGYEVVDVKVTLCGGSYHEIDSDEAAFESAGFMAMTEAMRQANPVLLEPLMSVEVVVPEEWAGSVLGDLQMRRADITGVESRAGKQVIMHAIVRLAAIIGYPRDLREMTTERATCSVALLRYTEAQGLPSIGDDGIGVTANKPWKPKPKRGAQAVEPPWMESDK